jgi:hypothetical protein
MELQGVIHVEAFTNQSEEKRDEGSINDANINSEHFRGIGASLHE